MDDNKVLNEKVVEKIYAFPEKKVFIPHGTEYSVAECLRKAGWITIAALGSTSEDMIEARRLACDHLYTKAGLVSIQPEE